VTYAAWVPIAYYSRAYVVFEAVVVVVLLLLLLQEHDALLSLRAFQALGLAASREDVLGEVNDGVDTCAEDTCEVDTCTAEHQVADNSPWANKASRLLGAPEA
jgi:hypothetical protein